MNPAADTIAAIATPTGHGGVGIVRVSGPEVPAIARQLLGSLPRPRHAAVHGFRAADGELIDEGLALYFPAPASFTGEHVLELHGHGGPVVMELLLQRVLELGVRAARAGEFSERAFLNDKIDLAQAEAIADLIDSHTAQAARAAVRSLHGEFSRRVHALLEHLIELRTWVEAAMDFPDEEIDFLADPQLVERLSAVQSELDGIERTAQQGQLLRDGMTLVIAGQPNAGKSSLLNVLGGEDRAIVSDIPGTTRDLLHQDIELDGLPLRIVDSAGIREGENEIEAEGIRRAREAQRSADLVLLITDQSDTREQQLELQRDLEIPVLEVRNKIDLVDEISPDTEAVIHVSALTGSGIDRLRQRLKDFAGYREDGEDAFIARERHLDALNRAQEFFNRGLDQYRIHRAGELLADDLTGCQHALGEITGEVTSEDLLGFIFSSFCIGK